jgi:CBS domain-containing protein
MMRVLDLLQGKTAAVWTVEPSATVYQALEVLAAKDIGALPVVENGRLLGMFSERDYARKVSLHNKSSRATTVGELMSHPVIGVSPSETIETCMSLMTNHRIRHLPVLEDGRLTGMVSIGDILKAIISDQSVLIRDLENYIVGARS